MQIKLGEINDNIKEELISLSKIMIHENDDDFVNGLIMSYILRPEYIDLLSKHFNLKTDIQLADELLVILMKNFLINFYIQEKGYNIPYIQ